MIDYVLGFAFTTCGRVALIQKNHPEWQAGHWNGIGGKREKGELMHESMSREFLEEAGVEVPPDKWRRVGRMVGPDWTCQVFTVELNHSQKRKVTTMTDEMVQLFDKRELLLLDEDGALIDNVPALIGLCRMLPTSAKHKHPVFQIDYPGLPESTGLKEV